MNAVMHTVHLVLAGAWLGGVIFTLMVVSPALKAMKWEEAERVRVRSAIGRQYATVGTVNLVLLLVFAVVDGVLAGFGAWFYAEYVLILVLFGLVAAHGAYFGRRLAGLASAERGTSSGEQAAEFARRRRAIQRVSFRVSLVSLAVSVVVMVLAINAG